MLVENQKIKIDIKGKKRIIYRFRNLGYQIDDDQDFLYVKPEDLVRSDKNFLQAYCDDCGDDFLIQNYTYRKKIECREKILCDNCRHNSDEIKEKRKQTNRIRYGGDTPMSSNEIKQKIKNTNLERYGVENVSSSPIIREKVKNTVVERYGVSNVSKLESIKKKKEQTCMEHFGTTNPFVSEEVKNKIKEHNIEKYGVEYYMQTQEFLDKSYNTIINRYKDVYGDLPENELYRLYLEDSREKREETNLIRYGTKYPSTLEEIKEKIRATNISRYKTYSPVINEEVMKKIKATNLERYGVEYSILSEQAIKKSKETKLKKYGTTNLAQVPEIIEKRKRTNMERYGCENPMSNLDVYQRWQDSMLKDSNIRTSTQQIAIFNLCKELYSENEILLNYPVGRCFLDIAIISASYKINIEYDAFHWHQDKQHDRRRDEFIKSEGWKVLRVKSSHKLPTKDQLEYAINKLVNEGYSYTEIVLDDWEDRKEENVS